MSASSITRLKTEELPARRAYKLVKLRKNGTLGSLFINARAILPLGEWMEAQTTHRRQGFSYRPGWHVTPRPVAPHLSTEGRTWVSVLVRDFTVLDRPESQGGQWWLAKHMMIEGICVPK